MLAFQFFLENFMVCREIFSERLTNMLEFEHFTKIYYCADIQGVLITLKQWVFLKQQKLIKTKKRPNRLDIFSCF